MSQNGKGSAPRKKTVSNEVWTKNWERIFGKKKKIIHMGEKLTQNSVPSLFL